MINERVCADTFSIKMFGIFMFLINENSWSSESDSMALLELLVLSLWIPLDLAKHATEGS